MGARRRPLFEVAYETTFCATHVLHRDGQPIEPQHGHDWRVEVVAAGETLDALGVVVDFEHLKQAVAGICARFHYGGHHVAPRLRRPEPLRRGGRPLLLPRGAPRPRAAGRAPRARADLGGPRLQRQLPRMTPLGSQFPIGFARETLSPTVGGTS